ncbi:MAG: hypothetical protein MHM6MM_003750 [Cercozoa sp. M6MM]
MSQPQMSSMGRLMLQRQLAKMERDPPNGFSIGLVDENDITKWQILVEGPEDTIWEGGFFPATLEYVLFRSQILDQSIKSVCGRFPPEFPQKPPTMRFTMPDFWHPNVYPDGRVCISILHDPEHDPLNQQESIDEKWRPVLGVEEILVSVVSMLADPNCDSPANVDASVQFRNDYPAFKKRIRRLARRSMEML